MSNKDFVYSAEHMKTLEKLEGLRMNFSMYLGGNDVLTQNQGWLEVLDNQLDEHDLLGITTPAKIYFSFRNGKYQAIFRDYGRGIPPTTLDRATGIPHTSSKFVVSPAYRGDSTGTHGLGLKLVVAISKHAIILSSNGNQQGFIRYHDIATKTFITEETATPFPSGTIVMAELDPKIIDEVAEYEKKGLSALLDRIQFLCVFSAKFNVHVNLINTWINFEELEKMAHHDKITSVFNYVDNLKVKSNVFNNDHPITMEEYIRRRFDTSSPIVWELNDFIDDTSDERIRYDIRLFLTKNLKISKGGTIAAINMLQINDPQSHHISCLHEVIKDAMRDMIDDEDMRNWFCTSFKMPLYMVIKLRYVKAKFTDQTKKGFRDGNFSKRYKVMLSEHFDRLDPSVLRDLYELLKEEIEKKFLEAFSKTYITAKGLKNISLYLNNSKGFQPCISTDKELTELYIVEGKSAFSNATAACNPLTQAVYAQQGKPINGFKTPRDKFLSFAQIKDLMLILGVSPKDKDISNMNFGKVCILSDADEHGYHMSILAMGNLMTINPLIVDSNKVVITNPPLYAVAMKENVLFLKDFDALMESRTETLFFPFYDFHVNMFGSEMYTKVEGEGASGTNPYMNLCYLIAHVGVLISKAASSIGIDENTLENLLKSIIYTHGNYTLDIEKAKALLEAEKIISEGSHLIIVIDKIDKVVPWGRLLEECEKYLYHEYTKLRCHEFQLFVSTKKTSEMVMVPMVLSEVNKLFNKMIEKFGKFERFKGLGSMDSHQLKETCFNDTTRSIVNIKGIGDINKIFGMLGVDVAQRKLLK